ncbi:MAG: hypothetical protein ACREIU_08950, partial [Planctomycetota bacterium]
SRTELRFPLRRPRRLLLEFRPRPEVVGGDGRVECSASLATGEGLPVVEESRGVRLRRDGSCLLSLAAPPGEYRLRFEACGGKEIARAVRIEEEDSTRLSVGSP